MRPFGTVPPVVHRNGGTTEVSIHDSDRTPPQFGGESQRDWSVPRGTLWNAAIAVMFHVEHSVETMALSSQNLLPGNKLHRFSDCTQIRRCIAHRFRIILGPSLHSPKTEWDA